ncbi:MAG: tetratricopeptide repeat protein [Magnetococcales bacterium]|nr:tetratricopeptide repeat protein [Magnetococcales bacterium]
MAENKVFLSHASEDKPLAEGLRRGLSEHGVEAWIDHRYLTGGDDLPEEIKQQIDDADYFMVILSLDAMNSEWVAKETDWALARKDQLKIVPVTLGETVKPSLVKRFLGGRELKVLTLRDDDLQELMPHLLDALGRRLPGYEPPRPIPAAPPVEELVLILDQCAIAEKEGKRRGKARARLEYHPADRSEKVESGGYDFEAPLGPIEAEELAWYLERFTRWPGEAFRGRARAVESALPRWGRALFDAALGAPVAAKLTEEWLRSPGAQRRFSVKVGELLPSGDAPPDEATQARLAASAHLLGLPWELLHDAEGYLFQGRKPTRVRRRLPNRKKRDPLFTQPPLRVLILSPRPEDEQAGYIDHRVTALPLAEALDTLGALAELTVLEKPSFPGLMAALRKAEEIGKPFHVVHFDGHGVYLRDKGLGALCFEAPDQDQTLVRRKTAIVVADDLAKELRDYRIPLFFLEACQSAQAEIDPAGSVAARLMDQGVAAVAAMSHSVLVVTAREFVTVFYHKLAEGVRVGEAMLAGQRHLFEQKKRGHYIGAGELELHDWFVPVLFQEQEDRPLVGKVPSEAAKSLIHQRHKARLGALPDSPAHGFSGRSRELLALERLLLVERYAVLLGEGGEGKTALAVEAARWLARIHRVERVAFVSLETSTHVLTVLHELGLQVVGKEYAATKYPDLDQALLPLERALREQKTLLVLDNLETVLPPRPGAPLGAHDAEELKRILSLVKRLGEMGNTLLLFTSRERLPSPFDAPRHHVDIGPLAPWDAVEMVKNVLLRAGVEPPKGQSGDKEEALLELVQTVHCHARTLALLAPELARHGVPATTAELHQLMASLEQRYPGERERSLYAGVALSLNRLSPEMRRLIRPLGVFQGGGHIANVGHVLGVKDRQQLQFMAAELAQTGLCDRHENGYLSFHFALCPFLWGEMDEVEQETARQRWLAGEYQFAQFLHQQRFQDANLSSALALLDLSNLLAGLEQAAKRWPPEQALQWASALATVLQNLGKRSAQQRVAEIREGLTAKLGEGWSHARFNAAAQHVEHLAAQGRLNEARDAALALLQRCQSAGEDAYAEAPYDLATAHALAGRFTRFIGASAQAIPLFQEARSRFQRLGATDPNARQMAAAALNDLGDCLRQLGQLDDAAKCYEQAAKESEQEGHRRGVAVSKGQLGTVRKNQGRYAEALQAYQEARETFTQLKEPATVATVWHQTGMVYQAMEQWGAAEEAYQQALKIRTSLSIETEVAATLDQLGILYGRQQRWEEAVVYHRQAADICHRLKDPSKEGRSRNNLAVPLIQLKRYDEAREAIQRAIVCKEPFGHAAEPWTSWAILADLEIAVGRAAEATAARQKARQLFAQYRRDDGENHTTGAQLCQMVGTAIQQGAAAQARQQLAEVAQQPNLPDWAQALIKVLLAILDGSRDPALADAPGLNYDDAVEVELLLKQLKAG